MAYPAEVIANWFLCQEEMTHKKLQKLCYYAQAWSYALFSRPIIDDVFQAWAHGPVSPKLYSKYRGSYLVRLHPETFDFLVTEEDEDLLERVWITYKDQTPNGLEALSRQEPPWRLARKENAQSEKGGSPISSEAMKEYYRSVYIDGEQ